MNDLENLASLIGEKCALRHRDEPGDAVNAICQYLGTSNGIQSEVTQELRIPICQECLEAILSKEWVVIYCATCHSSQWICKELARRSYDTEVIILGSCPVCYDMEGK